MNIVVAFFCGIVMSLGLIISGMINPQKVIGFLDLFGRFDPTLAFVMAGALSVTAMGYRLSKRVKPLLCENFDLPQNKKIDGRLILGAAVFGTGWGLAGFCPAPAIVGAGLGFYKAVIFLIAMVAGMFLAKRF